MDARVRLAIVVGLGLFPMLAPAEERVTVAVDFTSLDAESFRALDGLALEKLVLLRLVQEGLAVVAPSARPDISISLMSTTEGLVLGANRAGQLRRRVLPKGNEPLAELHLEIAQKAVELARALRALRTLGDAPTAPPPARAAPAPPVEKPRPRRARFATGVGLDALWRDGGVDPLVRLSGMLSVGRGVSLHLVTGVAPAPSAAISVVEWQAQVGAGYRFVIRSYFSLEVSGLVGLLLHHYETQNVTDRGIRLGFLGSLPLLLMFSPHRRVGIEVRVAPGLGDTGRSHEAGGQVLWLRGAWRLEAGAGVVWRW